MPFFLGKVDQSFSSRQVLPGACMKQQLSMMLGQPDRHGSLRMLVLSLHHGSEIRVFLSFLLRIPVSLPLDPVLTVLLQLRHWTWAAP